jgi:hypothetical protein
MTTIKEKLEIGEIPANKELFDNLIDANTILAKSNDELMEDYRKAVIKNYERNVKMSMLQISLAEEICKRHLREKFGNEGAIDE